MIGRRQSQTAGDYAILVQAGRDVNLVVKKAPPNVKLAKISIVDKHDHGALKQKLTLVLKNNGDTSAVLLSGHLIVEASETITNCNDIHARYKLVKSDWTYDVDLNAKDPKFIGKHALAPNEVISFDISVGRKSGGQELTIYKVRLKLKFDEGPDLETAHFFLQIAGPTSIAGSFTPKGPTKEEWGRCMAQIIRKLDRIGYDLRPTITSRSKKIIAEIAPELFK
jgi:hypothetical protein